MKIENLYQKFNVQTEQVKQAQTQELNQKATQANQQPAVERDRVEISQTARDIKKIESIVKTSPDVRADKVRAIKEQIESGTYQVDSKKVANAMLADLLKDIA
ncbi:Anti-sigma-28 factor FlgM family protein [Thermodesulfatator indicus DSM 15286]|uniref:Negative regulator of flagellin synthesis n=1 Tax=Thermodesulfatator indicus (strain DSM 15286 / JCM 11887 / CIR29812) TaxID=667014 RepID=F8AC13_THEID|nr:flagellar biosynthesis anti-sigma factor FlgM [Thermodesulfatator indicus]AEH44568.1 Anti-sigma-28 factor FlgM family protein [Thermodesulfatator indicus DSM 15286]